jgi:lipopolysaccharide transport system permease protein
MLPIRTLRRQAFLVKELVKRDLEARYAGSLFGRLWSFAQPLWLLLLFTFVFSTVMKVPLVGTRTQHFSVFLFCGLMPWAAFQEGVQRAASSITDNAMLVKKLRFPPENLVLAPILSALLQQGIAALIFVGVLAYLGELTWGGLPLLLLAVPLQVALTLGLGLLLSSVHVFFRDTTQVLGLVLTGWFYLTPIVYPRSLVPARFRPWIDWNPLTALVELYRQAFLGGSLALAPGTFPLIAAAVVLVCVGLWLFRRLKATFVDEI